MTRKYKHSLLVLVVSSLLVFVMLAIGSVVAIAVLAVPPSPSRTFRRFVCDPIPKSVRQIEVDRASGFWFLGDYTYILHFHIDRADLSLILSSRPFKEIQYIEYDAKTGSLSWGDHRFGNRAGLILYSPHSGQTYPEWFSLERWDNPRVYISEKERADLYQVQLLVYNEEVGEAYFISVRAPL